MRYIIICILLGLSIFTLSAKAADDKIVKELDQGSCWISQNDEEIKLSVFNTNQSIVVDQMILGELIDEINGQLQQRLNIKFDAKEFSLFAHCGTYGASFVINATGEHPLCIWANVQNGQINLTQISSRRVEDGKFCNGLSFGEFVVQSLDDEAWEKFHQDQKWQNKIEKVERVIDGVYKIQLKKSFYFKELLLQKELEQSGYFKYVDLNGYNHSAGESYFLRTFSLP